MELILPDLISLNDATLSLISDVDESARRVVQYRPLPREAVQKINDELLGERVYSSNAIEGNTLELRETVLILEHGIDGFQKKREALEARNLGEAIRTVSDWIRKKDICHSTERLLEIHRIILREIDDSWAGRFRTMRVMIRGAKLQPPGVDLVVPLVERILNTLASPPSEVNPLVLGTWAHWAIARVHPFSDGNGRIARLWQDLIFFQSELTCAIVRPQDRREYLDALSQADEGDFNAFVQLMSRRVLHTFDRYLAVLTELTGLDDFVREVVGEADVRLTEQRKLSYTRWARKMEQLRFDFEVCAAKISQKSQNLRVQVRPYDIIDQTQWENIQSGIRTEHTWFFTVDFASGAHRKKYFFFFGKHYWSDTDTSDERAERPVSLFVSEDDGSGTGVRLDQIPNCPITLREVFVVNDRLIRKRAPTDDGSEAVYDRDISSLEIAQDFFKEVILTRLT